MNAPISISCSKPQMTLAKILWPKTSSIPQSFSLSTSIISYITKNPSTPEVYNKLIQSCKYFFEKNSILIVKRMKETTICSMDEEECDKNYQACCVVFDINKTTSKFWITEKLGLGINNIPNFISILCSKIYRSEIEQLRLLGESIEFDEFKLLCSTVKSVVLFMVQIIDSDGKDVMLDAILESIPNVENFFTFRDPYKPGVSVSPATFKNILKFKNLDNLIKIALSFIPEGFEVNDLSEFIKNHKDTVIAFEFREDISLEYRNQLDALIDTIIESNVFNQIIEYSGQDEDKLAILESRDIVHNMMESDDEFGEDEDSDDDENGVYYFGWNDNEETDDDEGEDSDDNDELYYYDN